jgi:hypothetical protein
MNYQITFNPDGGDLGRAALKQISPIEFHTILPHIAHILECLYKTGNFELPCVYGFEFSIQDKHIILAEMINVKLPPHVYFYITDGIKLFEIRGANGGVVSGLICYLVTWKEGKSE